MPVILEPNSDALWSWLDPQRSSWSAELQALLRPFSGELEVYPVHQDVGKVGNNSAAFVRPLDDAANKSNIVHFFKSQSEIQDNGKKRKASPEAPSERNIATKTPKIEARSAVKNVAAEAQKSGQITKYFKRCA